MKKFCLFDDGYRVLSLFDGMSCGMIVMLVAGFSVKEYIAYEIDKYAIQTSSHNFPFIKQMGDVFDADFTEYEGFDFVVGGSPCTYWSIAQKNHRETEASGMGWELFSQYVRAIKEAKPRYFIYENNKSMSKAIRQSITETFGFEPICINSALVSAQNRQRLYWVGKRNADGTYSKVNVEQPEDRGILLKDILESGHYLSDKAHCVLSSCGRTTHREFFQKNQGDVVAESVRIPSYGNEDKARPVTYSYAKQGAGQVDKNCFPSNPNKQLYDYVTVPVRIPPYGKEDKSRPVGATYPSHAGTGEGSLEQRMFSDNPNKEQVDLVAEPIYKELTEKEMDYMCRDHQDQRWAFMNKPFQEDKSKCLVANLYKGVPYNVCAEPINITDDGKSQTLKAQYHKNSVSNFYCYSSTYGASGVAEPIFVDKLFAIPTEYDGDRPIKAKSLADGKIYTVYEVKDGKITIKGKQYPIKLVDGFYIIRKLTVRECMRLQTIPEWFEFPVSDSQAYKMLGNGWTVQVIAHLLNAIKDDMQGIVKYAENEQISFF